MSLGLKLHDLHSHTGQFINRGRAIFCQGLSGGPKTAFSKLQLVLKENKWRDIYYRNLEYELPSEKRRRLARERSEKVFQQEVKNRVTIAKKLLEMGY